MNLNNRYMIVTGRGTVSPLDQSLAAHGAGRALTLSVDGNFVTLVTVKDNSPASSAWTRSQRLVEELTADLYEATTYSTFEKACRGYDRAVEALEARLIALGHL